MQKTPVTGNKYEKQYAIIYDENVMWIHKYGIYETINLFLMFKIKSSL